ncbi:hypothetical protein OZX60_01600 [Streptococcaceae bacterium ESL0687]|nr:hypothetical protein OZX60_01600 [Streptococcaceae bacterium ESL0687]
MNLKKTLPLLAISLLACGSLLACTSKSLSKDKTDTSTSLNSSSITEDKKGVFTGVLAEDVSQLDDADKAYRFSLKDVEATSDPNDIEGILQANGIVLNLSKDQLPKDFKEGDYKEGDKISFTIEGHPAMTNSLPPQIVGQVVSSVEKVK